MNDKITSMAAYEYGVEAERERIIALLDQHHLKWSVGDGWHHADMQTCTACRHIALIKGENE